MNTLNQNVLNDFQSFLIKTKYKNIIKELNLEYLIDEEDIGYMYLVTIRIKRSQQNKGYGNAVMSDIIQLADNYNVRLHLFATNLFGSDLKRLYTFYKKLGFVLIKNDDKNIKNNANYFNDGHMIYYPKKELLIKNK